ncbi:type I 3-dehydroquinate dehydratase [Streptococcus porcinus]
MVKTVSVGDITIGQGLPKIIVPIVAKSAEAIIQAAKEIKGVDCDFVEWRIDHFEEVMNFVAVADLSKLVRDLLGKPLLVTFRTYKEGGARPFTVESYFELYETLIERGQLDLLDVELFMPEEGVQNIIKKAHNKDIKIVMCNHDFDKTPSQEIIVERLRMMEEKGADICKIAVMPQSSQDVLTLMKATIQAREELHQPLITMSMGSLGMVTRIAGEILGSAATFGAVQEISAPGQIPVTLLREILRTFRGN